MNDFILRASCLDQNDTPSKLGNAKLSTIISTTLLSLIIGIHSLLLLLFLN